MTSIGTRINNDNGEVLEHDFLMEPTGFPFSNPFDYMEGISQIRSCVVYMCL